MLSDKELEDMVSKSEKVEVPEKVENIINSTFISIRKNSERKRRTGLAVKSSILSLLVFNLAVLLISFNMSSVSAKNYVLNEGQLYEESKLKNQPFKMSFFNKAEDFDVQISKVNYENTSIYIEYTLVGNFNKVNNINEIEEFEKDIKIIGADIISTEVNNFKKISSNAVVFSETISIDNTDLGAKALIVKQNIKKISNVTGDWEVTLKIMKHKVKDEKVKG